MSKYRFKGKKLKDGIILKLLSDGVYKVDLETGDIFGRSGQLLRTRLNGGKENEYYYVRLYHDGHERELPVAKLVWMAGTGSVVPEGFEVHHKDLNASHNWFDNLFCLHPIDHRKLHRGISLIEEPEELQKIPF